MTRPYITWKNAIANRTPEMTAHYARFNSYDMRIPDMWEELDSTYAWGDMTDLLSILELDWLEETVLDWLDDIDDPAPTDTWGLVADAFSSVAEGFGQGFGDLIMALDMYLDGMFDDDGSDSIGRMEDYDEMDTISDADSGTLVGQEYDDPEGRWLIVGQAHDVVNIMCIGSTVRSDIGFQSCVPIEEAQHYLTHDHTNW